jgi:hypothetical protein
MNTRKWSVAVLVGMFLPHPSQPSQLSQLASDFFGQLAGVENSLRAIYPSYRVWLCQHFLGV